MQKLFWGLRSFVFVLWLAATVIPWAIFSLVASAWTSTNTNVAARRACSTRSSMTANGLWAAVRKTDPITFTTLTGPAAVSTVVRPRPGARTAMFAGRSIRGSVSSIG